MFCEGISFEGQSLAGMTKEEAKQLAEDKLAALDWNIRIRCGEGDEVPVDNLLAGSIDEMLEKAFSYGHEESREEREASVERLKEEPIELSAENLYDKDKAAGFAKRLAGERNTSTTPAVLAGYDAQTDTLIFSEPVSGQVLDENDLVLRLEEAIENRQFQAVIEPVFIEQYRPEEIPAEYSVAAVREQYRLIGSFTTQTSPGNAARDTNITLASAAVSGTVVPPGATFSILDAIGGTTEEKGYQAAGTFSNGEGVDDIGGGICQVSTTVYNAVIKAGLNTIERHNHSMTVGYVALGEDAMISYPNSDFKFVNNSSGTVLITMGYSRNTVWAKVYGIPVLEEGAELRMVETSREQLPTPEPEYEEDPALEPGTEQIVTPAREGYKIVTYLVKYVNGEEVSREFLHNSVYKATGAVIHRNSETASQTEESTQTDSPDESSGAAQEPGASSEEAAVPAEGGQSPQ